jgi:hypothetical protein
MSIKKFFNHFYNGNIPKGTGDRYYVQDFLRDFWFLMDRVGLSVSDITGMLPVLLSGGLVTQGSGSSLDITAGFGYAKYDVTIPDDWSTSPPGTVSNSLEAMRISWVIQNDINASSGNCSVYSVTDDGATVNYVKMKFKPTDGNTRTRAKAAGTYPYEIRPDFDLQVDTTAPGDDDICLTTFTSSGGTYTFIAYEGNTLKYSSVKEINDNLLNEKVLDIGTWNILSTNQRVMAHGVDASKIVNVSVIIRNDAGTRYLFNSYESAGNDLNGNILIGSTNITLDANIGGFFDSSNFQSTSFSRGWVYMKYMD